MKAEEAIRIFFNCVPCRDGVNPSGQYIAVSNLLEMATSQHEVDVFNAVHNIKKTQPYFITSLVSLSLIILFLHSLTSTVTTELKLLYWRLKAIEGPAPICRLWADASRVWAVLEKDCIKKSLIDSRI